MIDVSTSQRISRPTHSCQNNQHALLSNNEQLQRQQQVKSQDQHSQLLKRHQQQQVQSTRHVNQHATKQSEIGEEEDDLDVPLLLQGQIQLIEKLVHFTAAQSIPQGEQDAIERRKRRERKAQQINARRSYSHAHRSLVESLCQTALQRRSKAAQHIAQDPPADRLIGHNVFQYIPVALLPAQLRRKRAPLRTMNISSSNNNNNNNNSSNDEKQKSYDQMQKKWQQKQQQQYFQEQQYIALNQQKRQSQWISKQQRQRITHPMYIGKDAVPIVFLTQLQHRHEQLHEQHVQQNNQTRLMTNDSNNIKNSNRTLHKIKNKSIESKSVQSHNVSNRSDKQSSVATMVKNVQLEKQKSTVNQLQSTKQKVARQRRLCHSKLTNPHLIKTCQSTKITEQIKDHLNSQQCLTRRRLIGNDDSYQRRVYARTSSRNASQ